MDRIDRRERMAAETRMEILRAARRLFAERGYAATSINDIADAAGVAVQTIYARTGSKAGIVTALPDLIDQEAAPQETAPPASAEAAVRAQVRTVRGFAEHHGDIIRALITAAAREPAAEAAVADGRRRHTAGCRRAIEAAARLGGLRPGLPVAHATTLASTLTWHPNWFQLVAEGLSWDQAEQLLADTLVSALLPVAAP